MTAPTPRTESLAINGQQRADSRWSQSRVNVKLDTRDEILAEAIHRLESCRPDKGFAGVVGLSAGIDSPAVDGGTVTGTITGISLLGLRLAKASKVFGSGNSALTFEAVLPGPLGNDISVVITDDGTSPISVGYANGVLTIAHDGDTATAIAAAVNSNSTAKYVVNVTAGGNGGSTPADVSETALTGGAGPTDMIMGSIPIAASIICGGGPILKITNWTETEISVDVVPGSLTGGVSYPIILFVDGYGQLIGHVTPRATKTSGVDILSGTGDAGTWTKAITSGGVATVTHTANAGVQSFWIPLPNIETGDLILGLDANYSAGGAVADDIRFEIWEESLGADNASPTVAVVMGDDNADYDSAHNTAAERGDITAGPELHKISVRNAGSPVVAADGKVYRVRVVTDGDSGPSNTFVLKNLVLVKA